MKPGKVYLVGAGPGAPGLITVRGLECLRRADVVVYDHLVDESLLQSVPPHAERVYVGKSAGRHTMPQGEINDLLVSRAKSGKAAVRLKGGDPFVLGRGGEEAEALAQAGIPFEIVPGVTSATAVPAYAGIPVTHRGLSSYFTVVTGHEDPGKPESGVPWDILAQGTGTVVILMGVSNLADIAGKLMEHGRPGSTPVAAITQGTWTSQRTVVGTLADIAGKASGSGLRPPAVIVVGEVVGLGEGLNWFESLPLFGKRVLVTRPRHQAAALVELLAERGAQPIEFPAIEIEPVADLTALDEAIAGIEGYDWVVFTSVNGVEAFFGRVESLGLDARCLKGVRAGAIGTATADALRRWGVRADFVPEVFTSQGLLDGFQNLSVEGQHFLLPRGDISGQDLVDGLVGQGARVDQVTVYRVVTPEELPEDVKGMIAGGEIDVITFTSPSAVNGLLSLMGEQRGFVQMATIACIGPTTAAAAAREGLAVDVVAQEHTVSGLVEAIEHRFSGTRS